jgi:aminoglycoside 3-N-acetyltransferase I
MDNNDVIFLRLGSSNLADFRQLLVLFAETFETESFVLPPADHLQQLLSDSSIVLFAALKKNKVIGGMSVYILPGYYSSRPMAYIYDLAVHPAFQRQGIGRKLIGELEQYCSLHNLGEAFVQAESEDTDAVLFYRALGGNETAAAQFTFFSRD